MSERLPVAESAPSLVAASQMLDRVRDTLSARRVFGDPVERAGVTVIPVAASIGGGGGGDSPKGGVGGGFGGISIPVGVYEVRDDGVRFVPSRGVIEMAISAAIVVPTVARALNRLLRG